MLKALAKAVTSAARAANSSFPWRATKKSASFLPEVAWILRAKAIPLCKKAATVSMSASSMPLVVKAGVPSLIPPGVRADLSPTTLFLFVVMCIKSKIFSTLEPVRPWGLKSHITRWVSVPAVISFSPLASIAAARARALATTYFEYSANSGVATSLSWVARAAIDTL